MAMWRRPVALAIAYALSAGSAASAQTRVPAVPPDTVITLEREGCFGSCPAYRISVDAMGAVVCEGQRNVRVEGAQVAALLDEARRIDFFSLADGYTEIRLANGLTMVVSDLPSARLTITTGGRSKRVVDYLGTPPALIALERRVDVVTRSLRWTVIDVQMIAEKRQQGWMPSRQGLDELLNRALTFDEVPVAQALLGGRQPGGFEQRQVRSRFRPRGAPGVPGHATGARVHRLRSRDSARRARAGVET